MSLLTGTQAVLAILLIACILLQNRGAGLGSSWGGSGEFYTTRRGIEKLLFRGTILITMAFIGVSVISLLS